MMSSAYHIILTPFRAIVKPDDDYFVRSRKLMISSMLLLTPLCLIGSGAVGYQGFRYGFTPAVITAIVSLLTICFAFCVIPWYWVWRDSRHHWNDACMDAWLVSLLLVVDVIGAVLMTPSFCTVYFLCGFVSVVTRPQYRTYHLLSQFVSLLWFEYNVGLADPGITTLPLRVPGAIDALALYPILGLASLLWWLFVCVGLLSVINEYTSATEKATNSAALCYAVSEKLLSYDIQSAKKLLQEGGGEVDVRLRTALLQMVSNLELFRPHLPEYVWDIVRKQVKKFDSNNSSNSNNSSSTTEAGGVELDGGAVAAVDVAEDDRSKVQNILMVGGGGGAGDDGVSYSSSSLRSMQPEDGSASAPHTEKYVQQGGSGLRQPPTLPTQQRTGGGQTIFLSSSQDSLFQFLPETVPHVFYAIIDFKKDLSLSDSTGVTDFPKPASVRKLVNWAHSHALLTRGFLHCFVGDTIHASWSFHAPTTKPVKYVVNMYNTFNNDHSSGLFISGAISSGVGTSYMAGDRRQAYVLHIPWRDRVRSLFHIARPNCAVLLCQDTYITCTESTNTSSLKFRWIDVIHEVVTYDVLNVFEVMLTPPKTGSMSRSGNNSVNTTSETQTADELYDDNLMVGSDDETQSNKSASYSSVHELTMPTDPVSLALSKCVKGAYPEALKILSDNFFAIPRGAHSTMMTRLERKIKLGIIEAEKSILPTSGVAGGIKPFSAIVEL